MSGISKPRWRAVATYRSELGAIDITHDIEELDELPDLIEAGPDWGAIVDIRITLARQLVPNMTLEDAAELCELRGDEIDAWFKARGVTP